MLANTLLMLAHGSALLAVAGLAAYSNSYDHAETPAQDSTSDRCMVAEMFAVSTT